MVEFPLSDFVIKISRCMNFTKMCTCCEGKIHSCSGYEKIKHYEYY